MALEPCCTGRQVPENVSWTLPPQYVRDMSVLCLLNVLQYSTDIIDRQRPIPSGLGGVTSISGQLSGFAYERQWPPVAVVLANTMHREEHPQSKWKRVRLNNHDDTSKFRIIGQRVCAGIFAGVRAANAISGPVSDRRRHVLLSKYGPWRWPGLLKTSK